MISDVRWSGLTRVIHAFKYGIPRAVQRETAELTRKTTDMIHQIYVENLSADGPRKATDGLPVGVRSGTLREGAKCRLVNQWEGQVYNDVEYSGWIEYGTRFAPPRRPLGDAVDRVGQMVPGEMGKVMRTIVITK